MDLERAPEAIAWELRGLWATGADAVVTMTERCLVRTVVGRVERVSATGAFAVVDGWHLPADDILRVARATVEDRDRYAAERRAALEALTSHGMA